jgi:hypothetical protein
VIHVSQLKKAIRPQDTVSAELPCYYTNDSFAVQPQQIIDERMIKRGSKEVPQVKVQWSGMPPSLQTWESVFAIVNEFPQAPAWGQAGTRGGGSVTTHYLTEALRIKRRTDYRQRMREAHIEAQA